MRPQRRFTSSDVDSSFSTCLPGLSLVFMVIAILACTAMVRVLNTYLSVYWLSACLL